MSQIKYRLKRLTELRYKTLPILMESMQTSSNIQLGEPISLILKCHLLSEVVIDRLIQLAFEPNGDAILSANLTYSKKVDIASKTVLANDFPLLSDMVVGSLRKLNKIRNRLAHELGSSVSREEAIELFMGSEHPMPNDPMKSDVRLLIYHYTTFLFGNLLPKYEFDEERHRGETQRVRSQPLTD